MKKYFALVALGLFSALLMVAGCASFGEKPSGELLSKIQSSPQYDPKRGKFVNENQDEIDRLDKEKSMFKVFWDGLTNPSDNLKPAQKLPDVKPDFEKFASHKEGLRYIWFGHSTFLVNFAGKIILFDPVFEKSAAPVSFTARRFQDVVAKLSDLPAVDYVVISHDHFDHLEMESIEYFKDKETEFIVPLGISSHLTKWGIQNTKIKELDWWESTKIDSLEFVAAPAQHFSGRTGIKQNATLWASWVVRNSQNSLYFSGDSGYFTHFKEIGDKYGPFDVTFLENGQYGFNWQDVHMLPKQTVQAHLDLKGKKLMSVHWGMFSLVSTHSWFDPVEDVNKLAMDNDIEHLTPKMGEEVDVLGPSMTEKWWKKYIPKI